MHKNHNVDLETPSGSSSQRSPLDGLLSRLDERFGSELTSVVVYGSQARGEATANSDTDLMVVVRHLPFGWADIFALEDELVHLGRDLGIRLDVRLVEPEAVSYSVTWTAPLMLEVYDAHRVLLDPTGFFAAEMKRFGDVVRERGIYKVSPGVWRVPTVAR